MGPRAARALYLGLFGVGLVLYVVFVLPRWWVLTGDIPQTLATAGRIAAGFPIALAALPVLQILQAGLRKAPRPPELALRLRAWSAVLHVVAGALILLAAIAEIWLRLQVGGPWLFGAYGAAAAVAALGFLALYLSFVAEQPPAAAEPAKPKDKKAKPARSQAKKPTTKRGRKTAKPAGDDAAPPTAVVVDETLDEAVGATLDETETVVVETSTEDSTSTEAVADEPAGGLLNKRPTGKSRHRIRR